MPLIRGIDQPVRDRLADLPSIARAGTCLVCDPRGIPDPLSNARYAYLVLPNSGTAWALYRIDLDSRARQVLAVPPAAAGGTYLTGIMAALYDPTGGAASDRPCVYVLCALSAAPWAQWLEYDVRADAWTVLAVPVVAAAFATSVALAHTCGTLGGFAALNANIAEDFIYCTGNGGAFNGVAGPSNVAQYSKAANAWAYLLGAGGARAAAPAAGSKMVWTPAFPNVLTCTRGGASGVIERYSFSTDAWTAPVGPVPLPLLDDGTELVTLYELPGWIAVRPAGLSNQILAVHADGLVYQTIAQIDDSILPAAHAQNALIAWWVAGGYYLGAMPYGRDTIVRIQLPMPL